MNAGLNSAAAGCNGTMPIRKDSRRKFGLKRNPQFTSFA